MDNTKNSTITEGLDSSIPLFPRLKKLSINDRLAIEKYTSQFAPYSDFNFVSLWAWKDEGNISMSSLNGNLVMRFSDYWSLIPRFSILGTNSISQSIYVLLNYSTKQKEKPILKLVPEISIKSITNDDRLSSTFEIQEDADQFDCIYSVEELSQLKGGVYAEKRHFVNRFKRLYESSYSLLDLGNKKIKEEIIQTTLAWMKSRKKSYKETSPELGAIKTLLRNSTDLSLIGIGLFVAEKMIGFSISDSARKDYVDTVFEKADVSYQGAFPYLRYATCNYLLEKGYKLLNFESDMGILGLRKSKMSFNPKFFLKKYTVTRK